MVVEQQRSMFSMLSFLQARFCWFLQADSETRASQLQRTMYERGEGEGTMASMRRASSKHKHASKQAGKQQQHLTAPLDP